MTAFLSSASSGYMSPPRTLQDLKVSMFQIPEQSRTGLVQASAQSTATGNRKSMNTCILEAIEAYFLMEGEAQPNPRLPKLPLRQFTVRMPEGMKQHLSKVAAEWQIKLGVPVTMNAVVNTAILHYLQKEIPGFTLPEA